MTLLTEFLRVSRVRPCPVCERTKFCMVDRASPSDPVRVICTKIESANRWGEAGWLHVLRDEDWRRPRVARVRHVSVSTSASVPDFGSLARGFQEAIVPDSFCAFAAGIGLSTQSLVGLSVGWADQSTLTRMDTSCTGRGCWSFPMRDADGSMVGIRLRTAGGFKYAVSGSRQGIFVPQDPFPPNRLLIAEGPTDTAALLDLGFAAVGRPSCTGGAKLLVTLVRRLKTESAVIVADADEPGIRGAVGLAGILVAYVRDVRVIRPPDGIKDARAWKIAGAGAAELEDVINAAAIHRLHVSARLAKLGAHRGHR